MYLSDSSLLGFNVIIIVSTIMLVFIYAFNNLSSPQHSLNEFIVLLFFIFILIAFRTRGWDVEQYYNAYSSVSGEVVDFDSWFEPGFLLLNFIFKYMGAPYFVYNTVVSLIITTLIFFAVKDNVRNVYIFLFLFILFYFFRGPYGQVRQAISMLAFMMSIKYLLPERRNLLKYLLINTFALTFHSVSIVSFIVPLVSFIWIGRRVISWLCLLFIIMIFSLMMFSLNIGAVLSYVEDIPYLQKVYIYVTNFSATGEIFNPDTTRIMLCFLVMIFSPVSFYDKESPFARVNNLHRIIFTIGVSLYVLLAFDSRMASRTASFFLFIDVCIYANCIFLVRNLTKRVLLFSIIAVVGFIYLIYEFYMMSVGEIKYQWGF